MATLDWRKGRWISLGTAAASAFVLFGLSESLGVPNQIMNIPVETIVGAANLFSFYILYKVL